MGESVLRMRKEAAVAYFMALYSSRQTWNTACKTSDDCNTRICLEGLSATTNTRQSISEKKKVKSGSSGTANHPTVTSCAVEAV